MSEELAERVASHPRWTWREGMRDTQGVRVVDLDLWDGSRAVPDLRDDATAGVLLGILAESGLLTDVVRQDNEWIVAVELPETGLQGWAADTLGEAAAYALVEVWAALGEEGAA